ncbi:MAG: hypothetical protein JO301_12755 [Chitinophagaceae bacterium]|nr:hypothetical protein [Chitinophagaceae bacterium]
MKKTIVYTIPILFLYCSCSKQVASPAAGQAEVKAVQDTRSMIKDLDSTVLTLKLVPLVQCASYPNGGALIPCKITVQMICELSKPIAATIKAEVLKSDAVEQPESGHAGGAEPDPLKIVLILAPNTTRASFVTDFSNPDNNTVADLYRLGAVSAYRKVD